MVSQLSVGEVAALINVGLVISKLHSDQMYVTNYNANSRSTSNLSTVHRLRHRWHPQKQGQCCDMVSKG